MTRLVVLTCLLVGLSACPDNPYKASTWTKKLDDPSQIDRAVTNLDQLGDPSAIPALGKAWLSQGRPGRILDVIIALAHPLTPKQAADTFKTDFEKTGRPESWDAALPFLEKAISDVDEANPRSVDQASKAADAIGDSKKSDGLDVLIDLATKAPTKKLISAEIAAIRALGEFDNEKPKVSAALIKIIDRDPPPSPRTTNDKAQARQLQEQQALFLGVTGAAINALGDLRMPSAAPTLVLSMYRTPELFTQVRRALVACGPAAEDELRKILRGEEQAVNQLFKDKRLDTYCGDHNDEPADQCQKTSAKDFYPAVVLGDFYDPASVPDLLAALDRPAAPQFFQDDQPSPATQYNAIFDALRKIGSDQAAAKVRSMWMGGPAPAAPPHGRGRHGRPAPAAPVDTGASDPMTRILAIGAYPFVAHDTTGVDELGKIAFDNHADINLRTEAATAFARLSREPAHIKELNDLAAEYYKQAADYRAKANGKPLADKNAADKEFDAAKKVVSDAEAAALKATHETSSNAAADINAAAAVAKKAKDEFQIAKKKHSTAIEPWKELDAHANGLHYTGRLFQVHIARIAVALRCGDKADCYAATLKETPDDARKDLLKYIPDLAVKDKNDPRFWSKDDVLGLLEGEVERAMLELGKMGPKASSLTDTLLDAAKSDDRLIRQSVLLALPKIAAKPCDHCEDKLDAAIKAGEGKSTLTDLNLETTMLRNYFSWAGGKTPSAPPPAVPAAPSK